MLTPGEVHLTGSSSSSRMFGDVGNADAHIHALFGSFRNLPTSKKTYIRLSIDPHNTSVPNTGVNTNIGSPVTRHNQEIRFRNESELK